MKTILVVDDMAIFRDAIAACLRMAGYGTTCARDGHEALQSVRCRRPDLILLDLAMPVLDGLGFLRLLRSDPTTADLPVIVLSAVSDRQKVLEAARLGTRAYLLKSRFSMGQLLERIKRHLANGRTDDAGQPAQNPIDSPPAAAPAEATPPPGPSPGKTRPAPRATDIPRLLTREVSLQRAENALQAKTLSGVVAQVVSLSASPRGDLSQLAALIARDPMLSARVLNAANSAAYISKKGVVSTIPEAVRHIGCATIRNIATALGIFHAMPETGADGFNPIRCWQHSFAVATLCERLAAGGEQAPLAYLVGLCHDLGEILFHTQFHREYEQVLVYQQQTGQRREELERQMLGISQGELVQTILRCIGLPETIRDPIEQFHGLSRRETPLPLARILRLAETYANGLLLASSERSGVAPLPRKDCMAAVGNQDPSAPDPVIFRSEILGLTGALARLSPSDEAVLMKPMFKSGRSRFWIARHGMLSDFDPVTAAMQALGEAEVFDRLPKTPEELGERALVVLSPVAAAPGFDAEQIRRLGRPAERVLWLVGRGSESVPGDMQPVQWPVPLTDLAHFASVNSQPPLASREAA